MSDDDEASNDAYLGTRMGDMNPRGNAMGTNARANAALREYGSNPDRVQLGMFSTWQQPTVWEAVNYPREQEFEFDSYYLRYVRQSEAQAIIDKPANDTWQEDPVIKDTAHEDSDEPQSDFERVVKNFFDGQYTRRKPIHRLNVLDRLSRLGEYAILVLGFSDGRPLSTPVAGVDDSALIDPAELSGESDSQPGTNVPESMDEPEFDGPDDLMYMAVFGQDRVMDIDTETSMSSPRFRLPKEWTLVTQEGEEVGDTNPRDDTHEHQTERVHWTRAIHTPEGTLEDDLRGTPALKSVFHELLNIDKIKAASGEGFWRAGYQGFHVQPPMDNMGRPLEFDDDYEGVHEEIQDFINNFDREIATPAEINSIDSNVHNPMPHLEANYQSIAAAKDIPKSILTGEDRADTANSQDVRQWHQKIGQRRNNFATPVIVEPLIQRLIDTGVFPQPEGDGFVVDWQPLDEPTKRDEWEVYKLVSETINNLSAGQPTMFATVPELRSAIEWSPDVGTEVAPQHQEDDAQMEEDIQVDEDGLDDMTGNSSDVLDADIPTVGDDD